MTVGRDNKNHYFAFKYSVHQAVLLADATAPAPFGLTLERLGMTSASTGMFFQFSYEVRNFFIAFWLGFIQLG